MKRTLQILPLLLILTSCVHAQIVEKLGGTGADGGNMGIQSTPGPKCRIKTSSLPNGVTGTAYSQTVTTQFCTSPLTFTIDSGTLPAGLSINATTGAITGTPTTAAISNFVVKVVDSSGSPQTNTHGLSIQILCTALSYIGPLTMPTGDQGTAYNFTVQTAGGIAPLTFGATGLPTGETINSSTGVVSGTPSVNGAFTPAITITDSCPLTSQSVTANLTQQVN